MARRRGFRRAEESPNQRLPLHFPEAAPSVRSPSFMSALEQSFSGLALLTSYVAPQGRVVSTPFPARARHPAKPIFSRSRAQAVNFRGAAALAPRVCLDRGQRKEVLFAKRIAGRSGGSPGPYRARSRVKC